MSARKTKTDRSRTLDIVAIALAAGAGIWQGWQGFLIFAVALLLGGIGAIYNEHRESRP